MTVESQWFGIKYETESTDPLGRPRPADPVEFNPDLFNWYKGLIHLRDNNKALSLGDLKFFLLDNKNDLLGYSRSFEGKTFFIVINNKSESSDFNLDLSKYSIKGMELTDIISGKKFKVNNDSCRLQLPEYGVAVLQ